MRERVAVLIAALLILPGTAAQPTLATSFLCIPDYSTGFSKSSGEWKPAQFTVEGLKYLLVNRHGHWFWTRFGLEEDSASDVMAVRHYGCGPFDSYGFIKCRYWGDDAFFNRQTLRFQI